MIEYCVSVNDYKKYFNTNYKNDTDEDFFFLEIIPIDNEDDNPWEYSIKWINHDLDEEDIIYSINSSSAFAFNSCYWKMEN